MFALNDHERARLLPSLALSQKASLKKQATTSTMEVDHSFDLCNFLRPLPCPFELWGASEDGGGLAAVELSAPTWLSLTFASVELESDEEELS